MTSDALVAMIEHKLAQHGIGKVVPDDDQLGEAYQAFHHGKQLQDLLEKAEREFKAIEVDVPDDLEGQVRAILDEHRDLRWDDAIQIVLDDTRLDHVRAKKQKAKKKSGDFTDVDEAEEDDK